MPPKRRKNDVDSWIVKSLPSAVKATVSVLFLGGLSFIGSWGIDTSKSIAKLDSEVSKIQDQAADNQEKYQFLSNWLTEDMSSINKRLEGIQQQLYDVNHELRKR